MFYYKSRKKVCKLFTKHLMSYHVNYLRITNDKGNEVKNIHDGSNKNLDGAKNWLNK